MIKHQPFFMTEVLVSWVPEYHDDRQGNEHFPEAMYRYKADGTNAHTHSVYELLVRKSMYLDI